LTEYETNRLGEGSAVSGRMTVKNNAQAVAVLEKT